MNLADYQNNSVSFPAGQPYVKVVVYFTDGLMNTVQDSLTCTNPSPGPGKTLYNFGGYDSGTQFDFFDPTKDTWETGDLSYYYAGTNGSAGSGAGCHNATTGLCNANPPLSATYSCKGVTTFPSQQFGAEAFSRSAITAEAQYRAIYTANVMRQETPVPTWIFAIGLGSAMTTSTEKFLATLANDEFRPVGKYSGNGPTLWPVHSSPGLPGDQLQRRTPSRISGYCCQDSASLVDVVSWNLADGKKIKARQLAGLFNLSKLLLAANHPDIFSAD